MILGYIDKKALYATAKEQKKAIIQYREKIDKFISDEKLTPSVLQKFSPNDTIIVADISALGTKFTDIIATISLIAEHFLYLCVIRGDIKADFTHALPSAYYFDIATLCYKEILSLKNKQIQDNLLKTGKQRGRRFGSLNKKKILEGSETEIQTMLQNKLTKAQIAAHFGCSKTALYLFINKHHLGASYE